MIRHLVMWRLKDQGRPISELRNARLIERSLESMRDGIPGLLKVELAINRNPSPDAADLLLISEFESWEALRGYEAHPLHEEFRKLIGPLRTERRVVDYEVSAAAAGSSRAGFDRDADIATRVPLDPRPVTRKVIRQQLEDAACEGDGAVMNQQTAQTSAAALLREVISAYTATDDPRWNEVIGSLIRHLHAFANEVRLTPQEWLSAIEFLTQTGQTCVGPRQEFILLSDALGLSSAVDDLNNSSLPNVTKSSLLGPFYVPESSPVEYGGSIALEGAGESVLIRGRVLDTRGLPIANAQLDVWHAAPSGLYAVQDPAQPEMNFRGKLLTRADGAFSFRTFKPVAYPVPVDGPVGRLLRRSGRHPMRPAHVHFIVSADGFVPVTTQLFTRDDPYIDSDVVFGVKPSLLVDYRRNEDPALSVDWLLEYDFVLARASEVGADPEGGHAPR